MPTGRHMYGRTICFASKSQRQSSTLKCLQVVNSSGEVFNVTLSLDDNSDKDGLELKAYIDPDYIHPTGQYYSCTLDDKTAGYTYRGLSDNVAKICAWLIDGIGKSCYEIEQKER